LGREVQIEKICHGEKDIFWNNTITIKNMYTDVVTKESTGVLKQEVTRSILPLNELNICIILF